ncbi:hypothetical protein [Williamsia maris]|uniref:Uncharacterized protein n=1 Tax=Williamsia maris TaxID=72806 RepID=A0ABT1HJD6_9NOCA|nr:hypothetical protein [Williamsia maris]MCP2178056.1 hypothetical protein [Williamsia maris]
MTTSNAPMKRTADQHQSQWVRVIAIAAVVLAATGVLSANGAWLSKPAPASADALCDAMRKQFGPGYPCISVPTNTFTPTAPAAPTITSPNGQGQTGGPQVGIDTGPGPGTGDGTPIVPVPTRTAAPPPTANRPQPTPAAGDTDTDTDTRDGLTTPVVPGRTPAAASPRTLTAPLPMGPYTYADFTSMGMGPKFTQLSGCGFLGVDCIWHGVVCASSVLAVVLPLLRFARILKILEQAAKFVKPSTAYRISDLIDEIKKGDKSPKWIWNAISGDPDIRDFVSEIAGIKAIIECAKWIGDALGGDSDSGGGSNGGGSGGSGNGGSGGSGNSGGQNGGGGGESEGPNGDVPVTQTPTPQAPIPTQEPQTQEPTTQDPVPQTPQAPPPTSQAPPPPPATPDRPTCQPYPACRA